jgi:hypothetical protein
MIKSLPIAALLGSLVLLGYPGHAQANAISKVIVQIIKHPGLWGVIVVIPRGWLQAPDPKSPDPRCNSLTTQQRLETPGCH